MRYATALPPVLIPWHSRNDRLCGPLTAVAEAESFMRNRTFFSIVIGCFIVGMFLAFSFAMTSGVGHNQPGTIPLSSK